MIAIIDAFCDCLPCEVVWVGKGKFRLSCSGKVVYRARTLGYAYWVTFLRSVIDDLVVVSFLSDASNVTTINPLRD
jgi:hypothetical protein